VSFISQPSYFPGVKGIQQIIGSNAGFGASGANLFLAGSNAGANSTPANLIAIGVSALGGTGAGLNGASAAQSANSIAIGVNAFAGLKGVVPLGGPVIGIGANVLQLVGNAGNVLAIGDNIGAAFEANMQIANCVFVGQEILSTFVGQNSGPTGCVFVGDGIMSGGGIGTGQPVGWTVVGYGAAKNWDNLTLSASGNTLIGAQICSTFGAAQPQSNTLVGFSIGINWQTSPTSNTVVGASSCSDAIASPTNNVVIGAAITSSGTDRNTFIGANQTTLATTSSRNIVIGAGAGQGETSPENDRLIIETYDGATQRPLVYGYLATGNLMLGGWTQANRAQVQVNGGTNQMHIPNGSVGAGNDAGGGYLYVLAGALHWRGGATDTVLAPN